MISWSRKHCIFVGCLSCAFTDNMFYAASPESLLEVVCKLFVGSSVFFLRKFSSCSDLWGHLQHTCGRMHLNAPCSTYTTSVGITYLVFYVICTWELSQWFLTVCQLDVTSSLRILHMTTKGSQAKKAWGYQV